MRKRALYELFIGLLSLMSGIFIIIDLMYKLPLSVISIAYTIMFINSVIFVFDYIIISILNIHKKKIITINLIDLISMIPITILMQITSMIDIEVFINKDIFITVVKFTFLLIYILKFKNRIRGAVILNSFNHMIIITTIILVLASVIIALLEDMTFLDALWWSIVTFTTVGYGDILLSTNIGKVVAILLMIFGIGFIGVITSTVAAYIINKEINFKKSESFREETLEYIKYKIDNLDTTSDIELEDIYKTLKVLKGNKKI
ncbi:potassium transporter [Clostridium tertium]|uniref:pH-gated potassium channel KcsA n=1 Tax=Clostridium tertium TaxID=1559 RepID=A0A6N3FLL8_9CLOT